MFKSLAESIQDLLASDAERWSLLAEFIDPTCVACGWRGDVVDDLCPPCTAQAEDDSRRNHPTWSEA